jgi:predicted DNA-binding ribbon-helix-helix protein
MSAADPAIISPPVARGSAESGPARAPQLKIIHRIVQHRGRRYSLKLGADIWEILERSAQRRGKRLNRLIGEIAENCPPGANLSATLRSYCVDELKLQVHELEQKLRELSMSTQGISAASVADACPSPCFLLNAQNLVLKTNAAAQKWLSIDEASLRDKPIDRYMQIKVPVPLPQILEQFASGRSNVFPARVICLRPGRLIMAKGSICPAVVRSEGDLLYFLMIDASA